MAGEVDVIMDAGGIRRKRVGAPSHQHSAVRQLSVATAEQIESRGMYTDQGLGRLAAVEPASMIVIACKIGRAIVVVAAK
jgi:hypothetical protein